MNQHSDFSKTLLKESCSKIRHDYQELIELTMVVLGSQPSIIHWRAPGPIHHLAGWPNYSMPSKSTSFMIKVMYSISQRRQKLRNHQFMQFGALLYTKVWTKASLAAEASGQDLSLWINLGKYESVDRKISITATKILENYLWYLSDEAVGLVLFSDKLPAADKMKISDRMTAKPGEWKVRGDATILKEVACLGDFATQRTLTLLSHLKIGESVLTIPPENWIQNEDYKQGRERVHQLRVVNNTAERGKKVYTCTVCSHETNNHQNMTIHTYQHTGERPYQCELCGQTFKGPSNLHAHKRQHSDQFNYTCTECGKQFRDRGTYKQHIRRHNGDKLHVCEHCGKSFVITSDLKKHIRTHTGEKPYKCDVCGRLFSDGSGLVRHRYIHTPMHRFNCGLCHKQFARKDLCSSHIKKLHSGAGQISVVTASVSDNKLSDPTSIVNTRKPPTSRLQRKMKQKISSLLTRPANRSSLKRLTVDLTKHEEKQIYSSHNETTAKYGGNHHNEITETDFHHMNICYQNVHPFNPVVPAFHGHNSIYKDQTHVQHE